MEDDTVEQNTGLDFPGRCIEPLLVYPQLSIGDLKMTNS